MKVFSIFTVEYQPEAFEKHAEKFRLDHLRLFFRWVLTIFYHETQFTMPGAALRKPPLL